MDSASSQAERSPLSNSGSALFILLKWLAVLLTAVVIIALPVPYGITPQAWRLLAIFAATIIGSILRPLPGGAVVLLGVIAVILTRSMPLTAEQLALPDAETLRIKSALAGYADPIVWLVLAAFFMSRGMIKTGLGRRIAFLFVRWIGHHSLGLAYALVSTDIILATIIPSNGARSGGIIFPIAKSLSEAYDSEPGKTAKRLGAFLMVLLYQCEVIICAMFLTGQASNVLIAKFAKTITGLDLTYSQWAIAGFLPGVVSLLVIPQIVYRLYPPEIKHTPAAAEIASAELKRMGPMSRAEKLMLAVFALVSVLWMTTQFHKINYAIVALLGIAVLLLANVLDWHDVTSERSAWDVFIWYGGLVRLAEALGETGITKRFAEVSAGFTKGWVWWAALAGLALIYFYAHYGFASITAHVTSMYTPFLIVVLAAGAPAWVAVLTLAFISNLNAGLTHYGTTPAPIYFGANYVKQREWWWIGLIASVPNILIYATVGFLWWKLIGLW